MSSIQVDGVEQAEKVVRLVDDKREHHVEVGVGPRVEGIVGVD